MSVQINKLKCVGCGQCIEACPGNLIKKDTDGKAFIKHVKDCWGCTSCLKECRFEAINFFLGADVGGKGSTLSFRQKGSINTWTVTAPDGTVKTLEVNRQESNKY